MIYEKMISTGVNQEMSSEDKVSDDRVKQKAGLDEPGKSLVVQGKRRLEQVGSKIRRWKLTNGMFKIKIWEIIWLLVMTKLVRVSHVFWTGHRK